MELINNNGEEPMMEKKGSTLSIFGREFTVTDDDYVDEEAEMRKNNLQNNFNNQVPKMFLKASFENYRTETDSEKEALKESKLLVQRIKDGDCNEVLMFYGNFGTGKTHLGCSMLREVFGTYVSSFNLCVEYQSCTDFKSKQNKLQMLKKYTTEPLLIIDEIGRGNSNIEFEILPQIVNQRFENMLPTVLITNLDKMMLNDRLGKATVDRLNECCVSVNFTGKSKRLSLRQYPVKNSK